MPGRYVTGNKDFSDLFIEYSSEGDIHNKKFLQNFTGDSFFPETYFELETTPVGRNSETFFLKNYRSDNSEDIIILNGSQLPPLVPKSHLLQLEILPKLYRGKKFDIRVYVCVSRTGAIMIYKNIFYRINPNLYQEGEHKDPEQYQFTTPMATGGTGSFFQKTRPGQFPISDYLAQLEIIIPKIYKRLSPLANRGIAEDLDSSFMIGGLDFIPSREGDKLVFLEVNVTPGWHINYGLKYYQEFYQLSTEFILGHDRNSDECLYAQVS
tara:strand:- start:4 stop:804 length:801 start_codon:yes stop_codon:yes gene_type:complete